MLLAVPLAFAALIGPLWFGTSTAIAHATLERTAPAPNAQLATEPRHVELVFDEPVDIGLGQVTVVGPSGTAISTGHTQSGGGKIVTISLRPGAGEGSYVVSYRVISLDTHPTSGGFFFRVGSATTAHNGTGAVSRPRAVSGSASEDAAVDGVYAACRYAGFVGLLLMVGSGVFLIALWRDEPPRRVVHLAWLGFGLVTGGSMGELVLQAPYGAGTPLTAITGANFDDVVDSRFGTAHLLRLALLALSAPVLAALDAEERRRPRWAVPSAVPIVLGMVVTWAYSGHAGTTTPAVSVPSDVLHLLAVTVWVGGLVVLATAVLPLASAAQLRATLPRWSALAMICVAALIVTGTVQTLLELDSWARLVDTTYGRLLLAKIGLLASVLAIASYSRHWVRRWFVSPAPGTSAPPDPAHANVSGLRRAVAVESLLTVAAVAVAAMLIEAAPGRPAAVAPQAAASTQRVITRHGAYVTAVRRGGVVIHLKVDPAVVGVQYIYLGATRPDGRRIRVKQWTLTVSNAALGLDRVNVPVLVDSGVGHHFIYGSFTMPTGGIWTVEITARTSDIDETIVSRTVAVRS
ncbi:MAG TPA: CopD family protein [Mycobacterium sp.]|nr:CopD family protein [Mycobacterium sp.]